MCVVPYRLMLISACFSATISAHSLPSILLSFPQECATTEQAGAAAQLAGRAMHATLA